MDFLGWAAFITAVVGGVVSLVTVYIKLRGAITRSKAEAHCQTITEYQDLLVRSNAHAEIFRQEIKLEKEEGKADLMEARGFFAAQLKSVTTEFTTTLRAERAAARKEAQENREAIEAMATRNAEEHRAIVASINELRQRIKTDDE